MNIQNITLAQVSFNAKIGKYLDEEIQRKKEYIKIFPTDKRYLHNEGVELQDFSNKLKAINDTNLDEFIDYCISNNQS